MEFIAAALELVHQRPVTAGVLTLTAWVLGALVLMKIVSDVRARRLPSGLPVHLRKTFKGSATDLVFIPPYPTKIRLPLTRRASEETL